MNFVNADLIAAGLSPLDPSAAQMVAARIFLEELDRLSSERADFAFETTLSGKRLHRTIEAVEGGRLSAGDRVLEASRCGAGLGAGGQPGQTRWSFGRREGRAPTVPSRMG